MLLPVAWAGEAQRLLAQVRNQFEARGLWEISFRQTTRDAAGRDVGGLEGRLLACPDGAFRVDAGGLHLLSDGKDLWRWEDGGAQVLLEKPGQSEDVLLPHQLLIVLEERFRAVSLKADGPRRRVLRLQPKSATEALRDVVLRLEPAGGQWWPAEIAFTDFTDSRTTYRVTGRKSWPDRAPRRGELAFHLPAGMELIDLRAAGSRP